MKSYFYVLIALATLIGAPGCGGGHTIEDLRRRASFDFQCPESELSLHELGGGTRGVRGCGHQATYIQNCRSYAYGACVEGDWVMNTSGGEATGQVGSVSQ